MRNSAGVQSMMQHVDSLSCADPFPCVTYHMYSHFLQLKTFTDLKKKKKLIMLECNMLLAMYKSQLLLWHLP